MAPPWSTLLFLAAAAAGMSIATIGVNGSPVGGGAKLRIRRFKGVNIPRSHVSRRDAQHYPDPRHHGAFNLKLDVDKPVTVALSPAKGIMAQGAKVTVHLANGTVTERPLTHAGLYTGRVMELPGSFAHFHITEGLDVQGIIVLPNRSDAYHVAPAAAHPESGVEDFDHVVYRESDVVYHRGEAEAVDHTMYGAPMPAAAAPDRDRRDDADAVSAVPYVYGNPACDVALWADMEFVAMAGSANAATIRILQRWTVAADIFATTSFADGGMAAYPTELRIARITIDETTSLGARTANDYLKFFSKKGGTKDWHDVCLAHGFTNVDYEGVLGLAYTAPLPANGNRQTGGICQAWYRDSNGNEVSHNTGMSTSINFGSQVGELQLSLVLAHEFGHNFGSPHDTIDRSNQAAGNYLMWPYAVSGAEQNHDVFSPESIADIASVIGYRGGCFEAAEAGVCGNFITDTSEGEECDCGGPGGCAALNDQCCAGDCTLVGGAECSPLDEQHGMCCDADCGIKSGVTCREASVCESAVDCDSNGQCGDAVYRTENSLCEAGIVACKAGECSGLCDASGICSKSVCELWDRVLCTPNAGKNACEITCGIDNTTDCKSIAQLGTPVRSAYTYIGGVDNQPATSNEYIVAHKSPGATCRFKGDDYSSGVCDKSGDCLAADTEESMMDELKEQYNKIKEDFNDWLAEDTHGITNLAWFIVSAVMIFVGCCLCCYLENHDKKRRGNDWRKLKNFVCCGPSSKVSPFKDEKGLDKKGGLTIESQNNPTFAKQQRAQDAQYRQQMQWQQQQRQILQQQQAAGQQW